MTRQDRIDVVWSHLMEAHDRDSKWTAELIVDELFLNMEKIAADIVVNQPLGQRRWGYSMRINVLGYDRGQDANAIHSWLKSTFG